MIVSGSPPILRPLINKVAAQNECVALEPRRPETSEHFGIIIIYPIKGKGETLVARLTLQELPGNRTSLEIEVGPKADPDRRAPFLSSLQDEFVRLGFWSRLAKLELPKERPRIGFLSNKGGS